MGSRASTVQLWQYVTAILLIGLLGFHLIERVPWIWGLSTMDQTVTAQFVYHSYTSYGWALLLLAYVALFHGLNGVRGMLLELRQGKIYTNVINALFWIVFIVFALIATATVVKLPPYT